MANGEQLALLKGSVDEWNAWREENPDVEIDLRGADLRRENLSEANLRNVNLIGAYLADADLSRSNLRKADLCGADLFQANLSGADLTGANLPATVLGQSNLSGAILPHIDLRMANLCQTKLFQADLREADLRSADLFGVYLSHADLSRSDLREASLSQAVLVETNLTGATLTGCKIYGISAWHVALEGAKQSNLVITRHDEPTVMVDNLEVAQFIYLLLNRGKLADVLNEMTNKGVLILGRFRDGGLAMLQAVADKVREKGYLPMLFDFPKSESLTFTQTIKIMVGLSRFVIADLSGRSVLKELEATVPFYDVPIIPIIQEGRDLPAMIVDLKIYPWFRWPPVEFANRDELIDGLKENVIDPAEEIAKSRSEWRAIRVSEKDLQDRPPA